MARSFAAAIVCALAAALSGCADRGPAASPTTANTPPPANASPVATAEGPKLINVKWRWDSGLFNVVIWVRGDGMAVAASYGGLYDGPGNFSPQPGGVALLDASNGKELWRTATDTQAFPAAFAGDVVVAGTGNGTVFAFDRATGTERWRLTFDGIPYQVINAAGTLIVADADPETWGPNGLVDKTRLGGRVWGVEAATGKVLWKRTVGSFGAFNAFIAASGSTVVASASTPTGSGETRAFDAATGKELWTVPFEASSPPAVTRDEVVIPNATMRAFATQTGSLLWSATPRSGGTFFFPAVAGDVVVATSNTHTIGILDRGTGTEKAFAETGDCRGEWFTLGALPYGLICGGLARLEVTANSYKLISVLIPQGAIDSAAPLGPGIVFSTGIGSAPTQVVFIEP